jgi:CBS domain-containing protein
MGKVKHILLDKGNLLFSIPPETTVFEALDIMVKKNIGALVVTENGKLKGIFTERDYARKGDPEREIFKRYPRRRDHGLPPYCHALIQL